MYRFEVGKKYFDTSACDHNCVFVVEIIKRSAKMVTFERNGKTRRAKIFTDNRGEYIIPDRYSMAPVFRADREYTLDAVTSETDRPAEHFADDFQRPCLEDTVIVMVGQRVTGNFGACFPIETGVVIGFANAPSGRPMAMIAWASGRIDYVQVNQIHREGWKSQNGSQIGIFV